MNIGQDHVDAAKSTALTHAQFQERRVFRALDGFRCLSIVAVVWHHTQPEGHALPMLDRGFLGVDMFFTLSGFLIVTLLLRERERSGDINLQKFHIRRALRIFPLYYAILAVLIAALLLKPGAAMARPFFSELPYHLTFTSNWIPSATFVSIAWSLSTEAQFYLVWPPIEKFIKRPAVVLSIIGVIIFINQLINFHLIDSWLYSWFGSAYTELDILKTTFTPICLGVVLAHILHESSSYGWMKRILQPNWSPAAIMVLLLLACNLPAFDAPLSWQRLIMHLLMALSLASCVIHDGGWVSQGLNYIPVRRIGVISYGMYLLHMPARQAADTVLQRIGLTSSLYLFLLCLAFTVVISEMSFRFYEQPFLNLKKVFSSKRSDQVSTVRR